MKGTEPTISTALSKDVKSHEEEWDGILKSALYFHDLMYSWMTHRRCSDCTPLVIRMPQWRSSRDLKQFYATDRMSVPKQVVTDYDMQHEVLEMVLSKHHVVGARFSRNYTAIVETPEQKELVPLPPPPPKGTVEQFKESVQQMLMLRSSEPEPEQYRLIAVEPQVFEIHLAQGPIRTHPISKTVSVLSRRATIDEIQPYTVDFHLSQKAWHERFMLWMHNQADQAASAALQSHQFSPEPLPPAESFTSSEETTVPIEIEVVNRAEEEVKPKRSAFKSAPSIEGIWISDYDVVLGVDSDVASTVATDIMKRRVVPFFGSKTDLRPAQVQLMLLMLQEELKDEEKFRDRDLPMTKFWAKLSDCSERVRRKENLATKWLKKENGDFMGPFFPASENHIHKALVDMVKEYALKQTEIAAAEEPEDPEPDINKVNCSVEAKSPLSGLESTPEPELVSKQEDVDVSIAPVAAETPQVFNLTGPIETLDQKAREVCQKWVDESESLLIKAAKKTLIDSFQADFNSFLFLFQLQLKRIKGGYDNGDGYSVGGHSHADDHSWVSAQPSVEEEDTRVADIEAACITFMNQMGNNMVTYYEKLSGDKPKLGRQEVEATESRVCDHRMTLDEHFKNSQLIGVRSMNARDSDPALFLKDSMPKMNAADTSLTLSEASTVACNHQRPLAAQQQSRVLHNKVGKLERPPRSPSKRREEEEDRDDYSEDEGTYRSEPTYDESLEETLYSVDDEDEPSFESASIRRRNRWRRNRDRYYDYDSPDSQTFDGESTVGRESTSLTLSPSDLSFDEPPTPKPLSWFGGLLG